MPRRAQKRAFGNAIVVIVLESGRGSYVVVFRPNGRADRFVCTRERITRLK